MPKEIKDVKLFVNYFKTPTAKTDKKEVEGKKTLHPKNAFKNRLIIHKVGKVTKFKLRTGRMLITYKADDAKNVNKVLQHVPANLPREEINKKDTKKKTKK